MDDRRISIDLRMCRRLFQWLACWRERGSLLAVYFSGSFICGIIISPLDEARAKGPAVVVVETDTIAELSEVRAPKYVSIIHPSPRNYDWLNPSSVETEVDERLNCWDCNGFPDLFGLGSNECWWKGGESVSVFGRKIPIRTLPVHFDSYVFCGSAAAVPPYWYYTKPSYESFGSIVFPAAKSLSALSLLSAALVISVRNSSTKTNALSLVVRASRPASHSLSVD
jgi:hypothetical protein